MNQKNFIPGKEADLLSFTANIATKVEANPPDFGVALDTATDYKNTQTAFAAAYALTLDPSTRNSPNIATKNAAKKTLIAATRSLVKQIQAWPGITDAKREELQITIPDTEPTPIGPPAEMPVLRIAAVRGRTLDIELRNTENKRPKPAGVKAANLFTWVGDNPPGDLKQWQFEGGTTKSDPTFTFPESVAPGTPVWVTALWINPTLQPGPACAPVKVHTNYDGLSQAA